MIDLANPPKTVPRADLISDQITKIETGLQQLFPEIPDASLVNQIQQAMSAIKEKFRDHPHAALKLARAEYQRFLNIHTDHGIYSDRVPDLREDYDNLRRHIRFYISSPKDVPVIILI